LVSRLAWRGWGAKVKDRPKKTGTLAGAGLKSYKT